MREIVRNGDLKIVPLEKVVGRKQKDRVLIEGEVTGHSHRLNTGNVFSLAEPLETDRGPVTKTFELPEPGLLIHEDHNPIKLEPGIYGMIRQREKLMGTVRDVTD